MSRQAELAAILWLGEPDCDRRELVGGKAAHLSQLAAAHRVPPGFCLTVTAFEMGKTVSRKAHLWEGISAAYESLAASSGSSAPSVAVRSSAIDEDSGGTSFAGQYESYLNVVGVENVLEAIEQCWASGNTDRIRAYRAQQGLPQSAPVAVLVQQLVPADVSAVVFSANPVSGSTGEIIINASWGLGESIVGGEVTPDTYIVAKPSLVLVSSAIADKQSMTIRSETGTRKVQVPRMLRTQPALTADQALELGELAMILEQDMGWPVDAECAYQGDELFLLQCRPITALADLPMRRPG